MLIVQLYVDEAGNYGDGEFSFSNEIDNVDE